MNDDGRPLTIIGAMSRDRVIGSGDGMPWDVPDEYAHFLRTIAGQTVILGRRSFEIFGEGLTSAHTIVVSHAVEAVSGVTVVASVEAAIEAAAGFGGRAFSAGGASIYAQTLPLADEMILSYIDGDFTGDASFPAFDEHEWRVERRERHARWELVVYRREVGSA